MRSVSASLAAVVAAFMVASTADARSQRVEHLQRVVHRYQGTLRFFRNHQWLFEKHETRVTARRAVMRARKVLKVVVPRLQAAQRAERPGPSRLLQAFLCIHSHEGGWHANTGNGYYGGLQFDYGSWIANGGSRYAPRADLASPSQQLAVAFTYWRRAGFAPWPSTARMCGLM